MIEETQGRELLPWEQVYNYDNMITRACMRLEQIRDNELVLGYEESAKLYHDTAVELRSLRPWVHEVLNEVNKKPEEK